MKKPFINENFLIESESGRELYRKFARDLPIIDYHCHLPPRDIALDRHFENLFEIWLEGDHYKWRAMRTAGVSERLCTGDASPYEKFLAFAETVPQTLRNPLYHWTHLELKRYFGINELLSPQTAPRIWTKTCRDLAEPGMSVHGILKKFKVKAVCTTDDPTDNLEWHKKIAATPLATRVYPTFRPDKALNVHDPKAWNEWVNKLGAQSNTDIRSLSALLDALSKRHDYFHSMGCRLSDHGLERCFADFPPEREASAIFKKVRAGKAASLAERERFASHLMFHFGRLDAKRGWVKQLHLGAMRNNNSRLFKALGPDTGFDSIGDYPQAQSLSAYLDRLDRENALPKTIIYNINPADNYVMGAMLGNFQGGVAGKIQLGSGWWFLDQKEAMEWQINTLSNLGLLSRFVGMLTDSRSFMSYPRHEYFRRVLCNLVGRDLERGEIPEDDEMLGGLIRRICFENARDYFGLEI